MDNDTGSEPREGLGPENVQDVFLSGRTLAARRALVVVISVLIILTVGDGTAAEMTLFGNTLTLPDSPTLHWVLWSWGAALTAYFVVMAIPDWGDSQRRRREEQLRQKSEALEEHRSLQEKMEKVGSTLGEFPNEVTQALFEDARKAVENPVGTAKAAPFKQLVKELRKEIKELSEPTSVERVSNKIAHVGDFLAAAGPLCYALVGLFLAFP